MLALQVLLPRITLAASQREEDETKSNAAENQAKHQGNPERLTAGRRTDQFERLREREQSKARERQTK